MGFGKRLLSILWVGVLEVLIQVVGQLNVERAAGAYPKVSPTIPWSAAVMVIALWLICQYYGGRGWPRGTGRRGVAPCAPSLSSTEVGSDQC